MSTPGQGSILGSSIIYANVDFGPSLGRVYRPVTQLRVVTAAGVISVLPFDQTIIVKKTVGAASSVLLPSCASWMKQPYGGFPLTIKDGKGDAGTNNITITPNGSDLIDGLAQWMIAADYASVIFVPLTDFSGWYTL